MVTLIRKHRQKNRGAALVEMAIIMPLLLILTFGILEYGWMFFRMQQITNAARIGVRTAILPTSNLTLTQSSVTNSLSSWGLSDVGVSISISPADVLNAPPGSIITVEVSIPYENIELVGFDLLPLPVTLRSSASMAKEGPALAGS